RTARASRNSTLAATAASASSVSRTVRRGANDSATPSSGGGEPTRLSWPQSNLNSLIGGQPEATTRPRRPQRFSWATPGGTDEVGREGVAWIFGPVHKQDPIAFAGEQHGRRGAGA